MAYRKNYRTSRRRRSRNGRGRRRTRFYSMSRGGIRL